MLKVGIIGTGKIFDLCILGYLNNKDIEISCLCNRTVGKAKEKIQSDYSGIFTGILQVSCSVGAGYE